MEESRHTFQTPTSSNTTSLIGEHATTVPEGPKVCPLCNSEVKAFFVNFNEKILMCENYECEFPFGHQQVQYFKVDNEIWSGDDVASVKSKTSTGSKESGSLVSATEWSELEKMKRAYESEDSVSSTFSMKSNRQRIEKATKSQENEEELQKNVETIKQYNSILCETPRELQLIRNKKWIKNLQRLQESSGVQLLSRNELMKLNKKDPVVNMGELKIDIDPRKGSVSSITIELNNKNL